MNKEIADHMVNDIWEFKFTSRHYPLHYLTG